MSSSSSSCKCPVEALCDALTPTQKLGAVIATTAATTLALAHIARRCMSCSSSRRGNDGSGVSAAAVKANESNTIYESEQSARQYMEFHYTASSTSYVQRLTNLKDSFDFPVRLGAKFAKHTPLPAAGGGRGRGRALDVGCATGATVFEMSKHFDEVVGIDYSEVFVHLANEVKAKSQRRPAGLPKGGFINVAVNANKTDDAAAGGAADKAAAYTVDYAAPVQGVNTHPRELVLSPDVFPERCHFYCGDAMDMLAFRDGGCGAAARRSAAYPDVCYWRAPVLVADSAAEAQERQRRLERDGLPVDDMKAQLALQAAAAADVAGAQFDAVLCSNLIDRVPEPRRLLAAFALLIRPGGVLILCDPYSWWEGATAKAQWLGGRDGVASEDVVKEILSEHFALLEETEEPFLIRDHIRHYQLGFSHCTVWRRK